MVGLFFGFEHFELLDDENSPPEPNVPKHLDSLLNVIGLYFDKVRKCYSVPDFAHIEESIYFSQLEMLEILEPILKLANNKISQVEIVQQVELGLLITIVPLRIQLEVESTFSTNTFS